MHRISLLQKLQRVQHIRSSSSLFSLKEPNGPRIVTNELPGPIAQAFKGIYNNLNHIYSQLSINIAVIQSRPWKNSTGKWSYDGC